MNRNASRARPGADPPTLSELPRVRLTFMLGLILLLSTAAGLLWVLGVLSYGSHARGTDQHLVQVAPHCVVDADLHVEFEITSPDSRLLEIYLDLPDEINLCKTISVVSTYPLTHRYSVGFDKPMIGDSAGARRPEGKNLVVRQETPTADSPGRFTVLLEADPYPRSVSIQFQVRDPVSMTTFSEGDVKGIFIVDGLAPGRVPSFLLILHNDVRVTSRDVDAAFDDPRKSNIYRYEPAQWPGSTGGSESRSLSVHFGVEFPDRDRLKDTLLVVLSALFGVGVSALFESFLASEIYAALATGLFGSGRGSPQVRPPEEDADNGPSPKEPPYEEQS